MFPRCSSMFPRCSSMLPRCFLHAPRCFLDGPRRSLDAPRCSSMLVGCVFNVFEQNTDANAKQHMFLLFFYILHFFCAFLRVLHCFPPKRSNPQYFSCISLCYTTSCTCLMIFAHMFPLFIVFTPILCVFVVFASHLALLQAKRRKEVICH
jgi:hypothetical protein